MIPVNFFNGNIYHMVHIDNLPSIFLSGSLLSKELLSQRGITHHSIAYESVQNRRDRIFIRDLSERGHQRYDSLHRYVPFYFAMRPPMLYVQYQNGIQDQIVILAMGRSILREKDVLFTDGNATNQQLSNSQLEIVYIIPETVSGGPCRRDYYSDGPWGVNVNRSNFYSGVDCLDRLDWNRIVGSHRIEDKNEYTRIKSAEVLVPDSVPIKKIKLIAVSTQQRMQTVNTIIQQCGLTGRIPKATWQSSMFY